MTEKHMSPERRAELQKKVDDFVFETARKLNAGRPSHASQMYNLDDLDEGSASPNDESKKT